MCLLGHSALEVHSGSLDHSRQTLVPNARVDTGLSPSLVLFDRQFYFLKGKSNEICTTKEKYGKRSILLEYSLEGPVDFKLKSVIDIFYLTKCG